MNAKGTYDPDGDVLSYKWWQYTEADPYTGNIEIENENEMIASFLVSAEAKVGETIHIVCEVEDDGEPRLTRYQLVIISVKTN